MASQRQRKTDHRKTRLNIAPLSALLGEGLFLLFGLVLAWASSADAATGTTGVPSVDGVGEPSASAADDRVGLWELVGSEGAGLDAELVGDLCEAHVFDCHRPLHPAKRPAMPAAMANPAAMMCMPPNVLVADMTANSMHVTASFLCFVMMLTVPFGRIG